MVKDKVPNTNTNTKPRNKLQVKTVFCHYYLTFTAMRRMIF